MDEPSTPDRPAAAGDVRRPLPQVDEANEADVLDQAAWADPNEDEEEPAFPAGVEANEADVAEQSLPVPDDDGHDRDRDPGY